jgi:DNA-binding MarR family transcriptional regulator
MKRFTVVYFVGCHKEKTNGPQNKKACLKVSIEERLGARLRRASLAMKRAFAITIKPFRISQEQYLLLVHLGEHDPATQAELSRRSALDPNTVMDNIRRLESLSLVRRFRDPEDGRVFLVEISARGRALRQKAMLAVDKLNAHLIKNIPKADQQVLLSGLEEIARAANSATLESQL